MSNYSRMNPNMKQFIEIMKEYSHIDYGIPSYALSSAEARIIIELYEKYVNIEEDIVIKDRLKTLAGSR